MKSEKQLDYMDKAIDNLKKVDFSDIEMKLDEADYEAASSTERLSHEDVFSSVRKALKKL